MNKDAKQQLLDAMDKQFAPIPQRSLDFGITANEYAEHIYKQSGNRISVKASRNRLNKLVLEDAGWKVMEMVDYDGIKRNVYYCDS